MFIWVRPSSSPGPDFATNAETFLYANFFTFTFLGDETNWQIYPALVWPQMKGHANKELSLYNRVWKRRKQKNVNFSSTETPALSLGAMISVSQNPCEGFENGAGGEMEE